MVHTGLPKVEDKTALAEVTQQAVAVRFRRRMGPTQEAPSQLVAHPLHAAVQRQGPLAAQTSGNRSGSSPIEQNLLQRESAFPPCTSRRSTQELAHISPQSLPCLEGGAEDLGSMSLAKHARGPTVRENRSEALPHVRSQRLTLELLPSGQCPSDHPLFSAPGYHCQRLLLPMHLSSQTALSDFMGCAASPRMEHPQLNVIPAVAPCQSQNNVRALTAGAPLSAKRPPLAQNWAQDVRCGDHGQQS
mmetsp:Transcript_170633/g.547320  ORF Transcript_170633/g.547320 Transcript_170633/m.547320 type:complete len:246 (+) Transcript_170633:797-1534(+)